MIKEPLPKIQGIVAYDLNRGMGYKGGMPWKNKEEQEQFRDLTMSQIVIMGRNTYDSIIGQGGRFADCGGLPGRTNIVISRKIDSTEVVDNPNSYDSGYPTTVYFERGYTKAILRANELFRSWDMAYRHEIFVAGGRSIYEQAIKEDSIDIWHISVMNFFSAREVDANFPLLNGYWYIDTEEEKSMFKYYKLCRS